jgi:hypothetical protein
MEELKCYIRRSGENWTLGRDHHSNALISYINKINYMNNNNNSEQVLITVPHMDGGDFVANFTSVNENNNEGEGEGESYTYLSKYEDEYGRVVEIMLCKDGFAGYINRVVSNF